MPNTLNVIERSVGDIASMLPHSFCEEYTHDKSHLNGAKIKAERAGLETEKVQPADTSLTVL